MRALATARNGKCLSRTYRGTYERIRWQCGLGHRWTATPNSIRRGTWCPTCSRDSQRKYDLAYMRRLVRKRGGRLLRERYFGLETKLRLVCREGHKWTARARDLIYSGSWCPRCGANRRGALKRLGIAALRAVARQRGGKLLSQRYHRCSDVFRWKCKEGHEWEATGRDVLYAKSWCPFSGGSRRLTIQDMRSLAEKRRGRCLSDAYRNAHIPLLWKCEWSHVWKARPNFVQQGGWCPVCAVESRSRARRHDIHVMQILAQKRGGMCISSKYVGSAEKLRWRCANSHEWEATPNQIQRSSWCPRCSPGYGERLCRCLFEALFKAEFPKVKPRWLVTPRNTLLELDGYCERLKLAWEYQGQQHYEFVPYFHEEAKRFRRRLRDDQLKRAKCREHGVTLVEVPYTVPLRGLEKWLREELTRTAIAPVREEAVAISTLDAYRADQLTDMRRIAQMRGGEFLSTEYLGDGQRHLWKCAKGHRWEARPRDIKHSRSWCPTCAVAKRSFIRRRSAHRMRREATAVAYSEQGPLQETALKMQPNAGTNRLPPL